MTDSLRHRLYGIITWVCRFAVGGVFLYSGFVKAIDPWGTIYKFNEYLGVFGIDVNFSLVFVSVLLLCIFEFMTGAFIVTGSFRRAAPIMAALLMLVMTPLTLWIALKDPVPDCGCFGDALIISNWATFWKNIALSLLTAWLVVWNRRVHWLVTPSLQWLGFLADAVFVCVVAMIGYFYQPLIDYRQYPIGSTLVDEGSSGDGEEYVFIYEKDGIKHEFTVDDELPDESEGWTFVDRKALSSPEDSEETRSFAVFDDTDMDVTEDVVSGQGKQLILFIPDLQDVSISSSYQINSLQSLDQSNGTDFIAVVSGSKEDLERWKDLSMAKYPVYTADDTVIKQVVRGNPAVVYLENGMIYWKSSLRGLPYEDFMAEDGNLDIRSFTRDNKMILQNIIFIYLAVLAVIILMSFMTELKNVFGNVNRHGKSTPDDNDR